MENYIKNEPSYKNNRGFTLVGTLMVLVVLSVLGMSIMIITSNSMKMSAGERDDQSVFYIAEAGAVDKLYEIDKVVKGAFETVNDHYNSLTAQEKKSFDFEGEFYQEVEKRIILSTTKLDSSREDSFFETNLGEATSALVKVERINLGNNPPKYKIISTGTIGNKMRTVEQELIVNFKEDEGDGGITIPTGVGVYSKDGMKINNGIIEGDLISGSTKCRSVVISGNPTIIGKFKVPQNSCNEVFKAEDWWIKEHKPIIEKYTDSFYFPLPPFPSFPKYSIMTHPKVDKIGNIGVGTTQTLVLDGNYRLNDIIFSSDAKLTLDIGAKDISIVVNQIKGGGHLDIKGTGKLTIYVKDNIDLSGHINPNGKDNLTIFIGPSSESNTTKTLKSSQYGDFNASIYAEDANIELVGSGKITGNIITGGKNVKLSGDSSGKASSGYVVYAPNAAVNLVGSGKLTGGVISKTFEISGGGKVSAKDINIDDNPFFPGGSESHNESKLHSSPLREVSN